jgi:hypothetical protein
LEVVQALSEKLGPEVAAALMECVPPFSWMELPTKQDLRALEERIELRFQVLDARFETVDARFGELGSHLDARLHAEVTRSIRWTVGAVFGGLTVVAGAAVGIAAVLA